MNLKLIVLVQFFFLSLCTATNLTAFTLSSNNELNQLVGNDTESHTKIVGGVNAKKNEFPWLVNLRIQGSFCGGALIDLDLVLTAGHCVYNKPSSSIRVIAGDHDVNIIGESTEQVVDAQAVRWHENYNDQTSENDIALIWLSRNVTQTQAVKPISVQSSDFTLDPSSNVVIAGWGTTSENGNMSSILQKVTVPIRGMSECKSAYASAQIRITDKQFCAGTQGKDSCQGDSGGPVLCNGLKTVCGVVSFGIGCARGNFPGVYAKVSSYSSWIDAFRVNGPTYVPTDNSSSSTTNIHSIALLLSIFVVLRSGVFLNE